MQRISVRVLRMGGGEVSRAIVVTERNGGSDKSPQWGRVASRTQYADAASEEVTYELEPGQRLIVEPKVEERVVIDPNQKAAIKVPIDDTDGSVTIAQNEQNRLRMGAEAQAEQQRKSDAIAKKLAETRGSPGPEDLAKPPFRPSASAASGPQASPAAPKTGLGSFENKSQSGSANPAGGKTEAAKGAETQVAAKASGTPQTMSGSSSDGMADSKTVKRDEGDTKK